MVDIINRQMIKNKKIGLYVFIKLQYIGKMKSSNIRCYYIYLFVK